MIQTLLGLALLVAPLNPSYDSPAPLPVSAFDIADKEFARTDMVSTTTAKMAIEEVFGSDTPMVAVAECESRLLQFDKPNHPTKNPTSSAYGLFQVMKSIHNDTALDMDMNIYTLKGNILYAKYLYDKEGLTPWISSSNCWKPKLET